LLTLLLPLPPFLQLLLHLGEDCLLVSNSCVPVLVRLLLLLLLLKVRQLCSSSSSSPSGGCASIC
jgi:hypothetical protein